MPKVKKNPVKPFAKLYSKELERLEKALHREGKRFHSELKKLANHKKLKPTYARYAQNLEQSLTYIEAGTAKLLGQIHKAAAKFEQAISTGLSKEPKKKKKAKKKTKGAGAEA